MTDNPAQPGRYLAGGLLLLMVWTVAAAALLGIDGAGSSGPLSLNRPQLTTALPGGVEPGQVLERCFPAARRDPGHRYKVVGAVVDGQVLHACYEVDGDGFVLRALVVDQDGFPVRDVGILKQGGVWTWIGQLTSGADILVAVVAGAALLLLIAGIFALDRGPARSPGWFARRAALVALGLVANRSLLLTLRWPEDLLGATGAVLPILAFAYGTVAGSAWLSRSTRPAPRAGPEHAAVPVAPPVAPEPGTDPAPGPPSEPAAVAGGTDATRPSPSGAQLGGVNLTRRELDVLRQLAMGRSNTEIAAALFVSEATVKSHIGRLLPKLGCGNRVQAAIWAREHGLVTTVDD